jgi:hypothetical protein
MTDARATRVSGLQSIGLTREQAENLDDCVQEAAVAAFREGQRVLQAVPGPLQGLALSAFCGTLVANGMAVRHELASKAGKGTVQ